MACHGWEDRCDGLVRYAAGQEAKNLPGRPGGMEGSSRCVVDEREKVQDSADARARVWSGHWAWSLAYAFHLAVGTLEWIVAAWGQPREFCWSPVHYALSNIEKHFVLLRISWSIVYLLQQYTIT